ncbi:uncharacterized protein DEA37_0012162 [Paragonimus westermani]|uniref:Uncharacterized protein n=1 Tax=Paragonimus westermani TaxID=34504 RepID=A0A5J4NEY5_9TREM|nr:uncharacterized protein DEA37_0012162 [Paragonimus westermani]
MSTDPDLKQMMQAKIRLMEMLATRFAALGPSTSVDPPSADHLARNISDFLYDPQAGVPFEAWYKRYEDTFTMELASRDDDTKVRLLLRKLGPAEHVRYANYILPAEPRTLTFADTAQKLTKIFGDTSSLFNSRFQCLQLVKRDVGDFVAYAGLSPTYADLRTRLLAKIDQKPNIKLEKMVDEYGSEKAIAHASRTLNSAEKNYSQVEKGGLAIIFAMKKFHKLLYGRHFSLLNDHKPLLSIFGSKEGILIYPASPLRRCATILLGYDFDYRRSDHFGQADGLSRLISNHHVSEEDAVVATLTMEDDVRRQLTDAIRGIPVTVVDIRRATAMDPNLKQVMTYVRTKWPTAPPTGEINQFYRRCDSLTIVDSCIMFADRVVIPTTLRLQVHGRRHRGADETMLKMPKGRQTTHQAESLTVANTQGTMVAPPFEFRRSYRWGILPRLGRRILQHVRSPPYHPQSNGQAERFVDTFKRALLKSRGEGTTDEVLQEFLFVYRTTPNPATPDGRSSAEALVGRKLRTVHYALIPTNEPTQLPGTNLQNVFAIGEAVYARDWMEATVSARHGKVLYDVSVSDTIWKRHHNQLRPRHTNEETTDDQHLLPLDILLDAFAMSNTRKTTATSSQVTTNLLPRRWTDRNRRPHRPMQLDPRAKCYR